MNEAPRPDDLASAASRHGPLVLEAQGLSKDFRLGRGSRESLLSAVRSVSFGLYRSAVVALVGESGSGKSTVARMLAGQETPTSGRILLDGSPVSPSSGRSFRRYKSDVQMLFQDPFASLNPRMTVGAAIIEPMLSHKLMGRRDATERVAELLDQVGLSAAVANRYPHEFSGGQRQRISIARALALNPRFIIADESVSALDVSVKAQVSNLLLDLQDKHSLAYLFISHDMAVVERMSHRVAVMYLGEIVEIGPRAAIFDNPQHPYTRRLISAVPIPDPTHRGMQPPAQREEIRSAIRSRDYVPPKRSYQEVSPGHFVQDTAASWAEPPSA